VVRVALKALEIYKMLPKKNCKECGYPTCLTFAMKLAAGKADADTCPYLDEGTKQLLRGATRPPIQLVKLGVGERSVPVGDEIVLFRHEKAFYHPPAILFSVSDLWERERIVSAAERVMGEVFPRVGENLRFNGLAVRNEAGSPEAFGRAVAAVEEVAEFPEVLVSGSADALAAGLVQCGNYRPVIHAATPGNYEQVAPLAKRFGCPLVIRTEDLEGLATLAKACTDLGVRDLLLDPAPATLGEFLARSTEIRGRPSTGAIRTSATRSTSMQRPLSPRRPGSLPVSSSMPGSSSPPSSLRRSRGWPSRCGRTSIPIPRSPSR
jgi:acetyl-CoA decarbonylase/synthase complex subunit gamma